MILYGASGHGKVIIDILESVNTPFIEVWDDADKPAVWEYPVKRPDMEIPKGEEIIISIGNNGNRKKIAEWVGASAKFGRAIHDCAVVSKRAVIGAGTVVMAGAVVNPGTEIGSHCIINTSASIDHDCVIQDYAHISPNATLSGDVQVGEGTHVGAGASVIQGVKIGRWCTIGAGSVVIDDIPDFATAVGNPARIIKINEQDEQA